MLGCPGNSIDYDLLVQQRPLSYSLCRYFIDYKLYPSEVIFERQTRHSHVRKPEKNIEVSKILLQCCCHYMCLDSSFNQLRTMDKEFWQFLNIYRSSEIGKADSQKDIFAVVGPGSSLLVTVCFIPTVMMKLALCFTLVTICFKLPSDYSARFFHCGNFTL